MKHKLFMLMAMLLIGVTGLAAQNYSLVLDGAQDCVNVGDLTDLVTNVYTVEAWINPAVTNIGSFGQTIFASCSGTDKAMWVSLVNDEIVVISYSASTNAIVCQSTMANIVAGTWYHIAVTSTRNGATTLYINGLAVASGTAGNAMDWANPFVIGALRPSASQYPFNGMIDEVRVWNTIRTGTEIAAGMTGVDPTSTGLVGYWKMDEEADNITQDSTVNDNDGTLLFDAYIDESDLTVPVEMSSFTATITSDNYITLRWVTESETNMMGYYIFRAKNGELVEAQIVSPLIQATNSSLQQAYSFTDSEIYTNGTYFYWLQGVEMDGSDSYHGPVSAYYNNSGDYTPPPIEQRTELRSAYPNPFNPSLTIPYTLAEATDVTFNIYNQRGQIVNTFMLRNQAAGNHTLGWDGKDAQGQNCGNGVYYIRMLANDQIYQSRAALIK